MFFNYFPKTTSNQLTSESVCRSSLSITGHKCNNIIITAAASSHITTVHRFTEKKKPCIHESQIHSERALCRACDSRSQSKKKVYIPITKQSSAAHLAKNTFCSADVDHPSLPFSNYRLCQLEADASSRTSCHRKINICCC